MRYSFLSGVALAFLAVTNPAQAATVVLEGSTAVAINNLEVAGQPLPYNVTFEVGIWPVVYGGQPPTGLVADETNFANFVEAINDALTDGGAQSLGEASTQPGVSKDAAFFFLGYFFDEENPSVLEWGGGFYSDRQGSWVDGFANQFGGSWPADTETMWVQLEVVPVPAAVWLFGSGLLGLVGVARKKKAA